MASNKYLILNPVPSSVSSSIPSSELDSPNDPMSWEVRESNPNYIYRSKCQSISKVVEVDPPYRLRICSSSCVLVSYHTQPIFKTPLASSASLESERPQRIILACHSIERHAWHVFQLSRAWLGQGGDDSSSPVESVMKNCRQEPRHCNNGDLGSKHSSRDRTSYCVSTLKAIGSAWVFFYQKRIDGDWRDEWAWGMVYLCCGERSKSWGLSIVEHKAICARSSARIETIWWMICDNLLVCHGGLVYKSST